MISGTVQGDEAVVTVTIEDAGGVPQEFQAVIDTGFTGAITLPATAVYSLRLVAMRPVRATLAGGERLAFNTYGATVRLHGSPRLARVIEMDGQPLIGMELLRGSRLVVDVMEGGTVAIEPLPEPV